MSLTENEARIILEEAAKAKEYRFCKQTLTWIGGTLSGVDYELKVDKYALKARLVEKH